METNKQVFPKIPKTYSPLKGTPKQLVSYWKRNGWRKREVWVDLISMSLNAPVEYVENFLELLHSAPLVVEEDGKKFSPRFQQAASLLYRMSPECPNHKRKHGGILCSMRNVARLSGAVDKNEEYNFLSLFLRLYGGIDSFLVDFGYTESNPEVGLFSHEDIRRGIRIPREIGKYEARCLAYLYAQGNLETNSRSLVLHGREFDLPFYKKVSQDFDESYNFYIEPILVNHPSQIREIDGKVRKFSEYSYPQLKYSSKALLSRLISLEVPVGRIGKSMTGVSSSIKSAPQEIQKEFLKGLLASEPYFYNGQLIFSHYSKYLLGDYSEILRKNGFSVSELVPSQTNNSQRLLVSEDSTRKFWVGNFCQLNPYLEQKMRRYYG